MPDGLKRYHDFEHDHFITFSCYRRLPLLHNDRARIAFETMLEACRQRYDFAVYAYVIMPEHVHLQISKPVKGTLASAMNVLKTQTSRQVKTSHAQFWQTRYFDRNIFSFTEFAEKRRYIHRNPVKRGLAQEPGDCPWSSFRFYNDGVAGRVAVTNSYADSPSREASPPLPPIP